MTGLLLRHVKTYYIWIRGINEQAMRVTDITQQAARFGREPHSNFPGCLFEATRLVSQIV